MRGEAAGVLAGKTSLSLSMRVNTSDQLTAGEESRHQGDAVYDAPEWLREG
jgi:hypothetical protein